MNKRQAKDILLLYRPGVDEVDPEVASALTFARSDPSLAAWLERQGKWHSELREKLRALPAPPSLADRIIARERKLIRPVFRQPSAWLAAAAIFIVLFSLAVLWVPKPPAQFDDFRSRMVRMVLREYRLDARSNDPKVVRQYMANRGGPADYEVTPGLERLELAGGGFIRWLNRPVSMICFYRPDKQMVYLFVLDRKAVKDPPPAAPQMQKVKSLLTASWSAGNRVYVLAGPEEPEFYRKYLPPPQ